MRRLPLLLAAGALWLFLAAIPALADGGPHVMNQNNGSLGLNADGCAGCHRIHTAQGPMLLREGTDETGLCLSCHGAAVTGATTDVMTGVQYQLAGGLRSGSQLGALRGGGFDQARIGDPTKLLGPDGGHGPASLSKVAVGAAEDVTSAHLDLDGAGGVVARNVAWGNGQNGSGAGPEVELTCVACHNPHGNGQYRILRPIPELAGAVESDQVTYAISTSTGSTITLVASIQTLFQGDKIAIAGNSTIPDGTYTVSSIGNNNLTITLSDLGGATAAGAGGTIRLASGSIVKDAALPGAADVRNYTVIQRDSSALLYASQVLSGGSQARIIEIASSNAGTDVITTKVAHGLAVGATVTVNYHADAVATPSLATAYTGTVATVPDATSFTLTGVDITTSGTELGWLSIPVTVAQYTPTDGDYFHRKANWATGAGTDNPVGTNATAEYFDNQISAWCTACHTRYYGFMNPTDAGGTGASYENARPGDDLYKYQHRTRSDRACTTCHVAHGSNAPMTGTFSSTLPYPGDATGSASSRLLKVENRGTCQLCHDPTGTAPTGWVLGTSSATSQ